MTAVFALNDKSKSLLTSTSSQKQKTAYQTSSGYFPSQEEDTSSCEPLTTLKPSQNCPLNHHLISLDEKTQIHHRSHV